MDSIPPAKLSRAANGPLIKSAKRDFRKSNVAASFFPIKNRLYITITLERPNLPNCGGKRGKGGSILSIKTKINISESSKAKVVNLFAGEFILLLIISKYILNIF